jgi:hypothetical protein
VEKVNGEGPALTGAATAVIDTITSTATSKARNRITSRPSVRAAHRRDGARYRRHINCPVS